MFTCAHQISIPGLHLSLGIFNRLYELLETACQKLDLELASKDEATGVGGPSFQSYSIIYKQLVELKEKQKATIAGRDILSQLLVYLIVRVPVPQGNHTIQNLQQQLSLLQQQVSTMVSTTLFYGYKLHHSNNDLGNKDCAVRC